MEYLCFRQPVMGVGKYAPSKDEEGFLDKYSKAVSGSGSGPTYVEVLGQFYDETKDVPGRLPYCVDLVDLFDGKHGMYRDARHQTSVGAAVIADAMIAELQRRNALPQPAAPGSD